jgi:ATP-dependent DNA ligase
MFSRARLTPSRFIEPCLPSPADRPPSGAGWIHEIKLDGFRLMARRGAAGVRLVTRNGFDWSSRYPAIATAVNHLRCRSCLLDGEVVICGEDAQTWPHVWKLRWQLEEEVKAADAKKTYAVASIGLGH